MEQYFFFTSGSPFCLLFVWTQMRHVQQVQCIHSIPLISNVPRNAAVHQHRQERRRLQASKHGSEQCRFQIFFKIRGRLSALGVFVACHSTFLLTCLLLSLIKPQKNAMCSIYIHGKLALQMLYEGRNGCNTFLGPVECTHCVLVSN